VSVFPKYAPWYDLLYKSKDSSEAAFVEGRLRHHDTTSSKLLDLGCGTGIHAVDLARQ